MPCKIQIKQNITSVVERKTNHALTLPLPAAQAVGDAVNSEFKNKVVSFSEKGRDISIPDELIDVYYKHEVLMEQLNPVEGKPANVLQQVRGTEGSKASPETIAMIKKAAEQMGIKILELADYLKGNPEVKVGGANGLADLIKGVVAVSQQTEGAALTEEIVHVATAILEQTDPKLVTQLIAKIDRFKIYKTTLEAYKNNKHYQTADGKPDIRKIKKEAVDKLIAEVIVHQAEGSTEFPELMEERERSMIKQWWETIKDYIRNIYSHSNIDIFKQAGSVITGGNIGTIENIKEGGIYLQQPVRNAAVDKFFDTIMDQHKQIKLNPVSSVNDKRHYVYKPDSPDPIRVDNTVSKEAKKDSPFDPEGRSALEIKQHDDMMNWGSKGHLFVETDIEENLIDEEGFPIPDKGVGIASDFSYAQSKPLKDFARQLIDSYKDRPGTRFIVEKRVINTKFKGLLASTVDFVAIVPDAKTGFKIDTYDWKFSNINKYTSEDVPWYKQTEWKEQMGHYVQIWRNYGAKPDQIGKSRMIPFISGYEDVSPGSPMKGKRLTTIEIGDLNDIKKMELYMLPVPVNSESTDNPMIDSLLEKLRAEYDKLYKQHVPGESRAAVDLRRDQLSRAIRTLHLQMNFAPLVNIAKDFLNNAARNLKDYENLPYETMTQEEINKVAKDLQKYKNGAEKYMNLDEVFLSQYDKTGLPKEAEAILGRLKYSSDRAKDMLKFIKKREEEYTTYLADKENIAKRDSANKILAPEAPVTWMNKTMNEALNLPAKIIQLTTKIGMNSFSVANMKVASKINEFSKLYEPLEALAKSQGKSAFDLIGKVDKKGLHLNYKFEDSFWSDIKKAKGDKDVEFLKTIVDKEKYIKYVQDYIYEGIKAIDESTIADTPEETERLRQIKIKALSDSVNMYSDTFSGFKRKNFGYILNQSIDEERFFSKEFREMKSNPTIYKMWEFFTEINQRAKDMGYLDNQGSSFFPLIEASILQKFTNNEDIFKESKDFFKDFVTVKEDEKQQYSMIDPETGKPVMQTPKYFTKSNKETHQLSRDLNKVATLWIEAIEKYEMTKSIEDTVHILTSVEKAKGSLVMEGGKVKFDNSGKVVINKTENSNAEIQEAIANNILYKLQEDANSIGNVKLGEVTGKFVKDEEKKEERVVAVKKLLDNANTLVRALAVGLKLPIGIANWAGYNFQAFINGGEMYRFNDFRVNRNRIMGNSMTTLEKALLNHFVPLNESVAEHMRKRIALKGGLMNYLAAFSFTDVMMSTNSFPERLLEYANALSFLQNTMIKDGQLVNMRQQLKREDAKKKYERDENGNLKMSYGEIKALESTFNERLKALQEKESLLKSVKIENDELVIPGVSIEEQAKFRNTIIEYGRKLSGQMNVDNKAGFRRDSMLNSFFMFKGWIPKQIIGRTSDIRQDLALDTWEYGRTRAFLKTWQKVGLWNIMQLRDIMQGTPEGLKILDEMLQEKRDEYYKKTGMELEITEEEFYDLMRSRITNQFKELGLLVGVLGLVLAAKAAEPPEDATELEKNRYKYWARVTNKIADEVSFYYSPSSADSIMKGNFIPALGLLYKIEQAGQHILQESYGYAIDDEDLIKKSHPAKYTLNLFPIGSQLMNEVLPYVSPEMAKEWGIKVTAEARRQ